MDFVLDAASTFRERKHEIDRTLFGVKSDGSPVQGCAVVLFFSHPVGIFLSFVPPLFELRKKGTVPAMADISSLLSLLEDKHRQAKQQCDDEKARNIDWLEETVANTKKQLLHRL
jgi:hypothetical protein